MRETCLGELPPPDVASRFRVPSRFCRLSSRTGYGHSIVIINFKPIQTLAPVERCVTAQRQQAAGAAQVGPQAAGAAQVGAHAAGAAQVGAQPVEQPVLQQLLRTLQQRILGKQSLGILKQCDFLQQLLQPLLQPELQAGAQVATGAAQLGAHAAGAAQLGAGAAHEAGAQPQPLLRWWNRPASALLMLAKQTSAAVIHTNFIFVSPTEAGPWNVRDCRVLSRTPCLAASTYPWTQGLRHCLSFRTGQAIPLSQTISI